MSQNDEYGRQVASEILGKRTTRIFVWSVVIYFCSIFWMTFKMPEKVFIFEAFGLMFISFLTAYGTMSLIIDIFDKSVISRIKRFFKVVRNGVKSNKIQQGKDLH